LEVFYFIYFDIYSFSFGPYGDYFSLSFSKTKAIKSILFFSDFDAYSCFFAVSFFGNIFPAPIVWPNGYKS
jgi:hypothetical protein